MHKLEIVEVNDQLYLRTKDNVVCVKAPPAGNLAHKSKISRPQAPRRVVMPHARWAPFDQHTRRRSRFYTRALGDLSGLDQYKMQVQMPSTVHNREKQVNLPLLAIATDRARVTSRVVPFFDQPHCRVDRGSSRHTTRCKQSGVELGPYLVLQLRGSPVCFAEDA